MTQIQKIKEYPKPKYSKCNAGHALHLMYNEKRNVMDWDCPICIKRMRSKK